MQAVRSALSRLARCPLRKRLSGGDGAHIEPTQTASGGDSAAVSRALMSAKPAAPLRAICEGGGAGRF
jgi:hypothetical protein